MRTIGWTLGLGMLLVWGCSAAPADDEVEEQGAGGQTASALDVSNLPQPGTLGSPIEDYAAYDSSIDTTSRCGDASLREGPQALSEYLANFGIVAHSYASCQSGFHPIHRALDVFLNGTSAMQAFASWITANQGEMARRLGVVQVIWNHHMWRSYYGGAGKPQGAWGAYYGSNPHTDHVHVSFGEDGAAGSTSFFTEVLGSGPPPPPAPTVSTFNGCGWLHQDQMIGTDRPLWSCDGRFFLAMQGDGNLVLYRNGGPALWSTQTNGTAGNKAVMQSDGNFVVYDPSHALFDTGTYGNSGAELVVQDDGNVVVYQGASALWATGTNE